MRTLFGCLLLMLLAGFAFAGDGDEENVCVHQYYVNGEFAGEVDCGKIWVRFKEGVSNAEIAALEDGIGLEKLYQPYPDWMMYQLKDQMTPEDGIALAITFSGVAYAHPEILVTKCEYEPTDSYWSYQRSFISHDPTDAWPPMGNVAFNLTKSWAVNRGTGDVVLNIMDTGVPKGAIPCNDQHPDFWLNGTTRVVDFWSHSDMGTIHEDRDGHSTAIAGIVGAYNDNGNGIAGINPNAPIWISKTFGGSAGMDQRNTYRFVGAVNAAIDQGGQTKQVVVFPYSYVMIDHNTSTREGYLWPYTEATIYELAIKRAYDAGNILIVMPNGNIGGNRTAFPAGFSHAGLDPAHLNGYDNVINVGAYNHSSSLATWSCYSDLMDFLAPGGNSGNQCGTDHVNDLKCTRPWNTWFACNGRDYCDEYNWGWMSGSSVSAAATAGLASLLWSSAPDATPAIIKQTLRSTCYNPGAPNWQGRTTSWGDGGVNGLSALMGISSTTRATLLSDLIVDNAADPSYGDRQFTVARKVTVPTGKIMEFHARVLPLAIHLTAGSEIRVQSGGHLNFLCDTDPSASLQIIMDPGARIIIENGGILNASSNTGHNIVFTSGTGRWSGFEIAGTATFANCTFDNLSTALRVTNAITLVSGCTFTNCGVMAIDWDNGRLTMNNSHGTVTGSYGIIAMGRVNCTNVEIEGALSAGVWYLRGTSRMNYGNIHGNGNNSDPSFYHGGLRNTFATLRLTCSHLYDNFGPGVTCLGGVVRMEGQHGRWPQAGNSIWNNFAHAGMPRMQIYESGSALNMVWGANAIQAPDGYLIFETDWYNATNDVRGNNWGDREHQQFALPPNYIHDPINTNGNCSLEYDRCDIGIQPWDPKEAAALLFEEAVEMEMDMQYSEAVNLYKEIIATYPKSPEALLCPDRMVMCDKYSEASFHDRRDYFKFIADTTSDKDLRYEVLTSAAWCLVEMELFDDAEHELLDLLNESDDLYKFEKASILSLLLELEKAPWLEKTTNSDWAEREASIFARIEDVLMKKTPNVAEAVTPTNFELYQNYPNPFNPNTEIRFDLPEAVRVELKIFNSLGQLVTTLANDVKPAGTYTVTWNGTDAFGSKAASGVYIYQLTAGNFSEAKKMLLMK